MHWRIGAPANRGALINHDLKKKKEQAFSAFVVFRFFIRWGMATINQDDYGWLNYGCFWRARQYANVSCSYRSNRIIHRWQSATYIQVFWGVFNQRNRVLRHAGRDVQRVLKTFLRLDFGMGFVVLRSAASTSEHQLENAGVLEPPSVCLIILQDQFMFCTVKHQKITNCAMLLPFKNS